MFPNLFVVLLVIALATQTNQNASVTHDNQSFMGTDYNVGPGQPLATISDVPWATLQAGDRVFIHWKSTPYKEKWVINRQGTASQRIEIIGVSGPEGQQPIIDGNGATTVSGVNYWNEQRGVIKIGGSNTPADGLPTYITIENLEIISARPAYQFTDDNGQTQTYSSNAASIYVEKGANLIIRNCTLRDSGNGLFIGVFGGATENILIENNYIYDNGIVGSIFEHNSYTEAVGITYQYNRFGPLRSGALGNNLKDRSAGLVVRNNWIESGNRQLDLVESGSSSVINNPIYNTTYVYGNILIEPDGAGNSQIMHYGGDNGTTSNYRKGTLHFYNNTVVSTRTGNTTLVRLSTNDESAEVFNNTIFTSAAGSFFAMIDGNGTFNMDYNWLKTGWTDCHCGAPNGSVNDLGNNVTGTDPLFEDFGNQNFKPQETSPLVDQGNAIPGALLPDYNIAFEYVKHQTSTTKNAVGTLDIGAYEYGNSSNSNDSKVGIGTNTPQGALDVVSNNSGLILPRIADTTAVENPVNGMLIYDLSQHCVRAYQNGAWSNCFGN
ncbi:MAG: right-handed parallel beta-helix repeat-containing protein [Bacteroidota bacterium]